MVLAAGAVLAGLHLVDRGPDKLLVAAAWLVAGIGAMIASRGRQAAIVGGELSWDGEWLHLSDVHPRFAAEAAAIQRDTLLRMPRRPPPTGVRGRAVT
jgi:hypothetical protein